jgi:hypothetical protein
MRSYSEFVDGILVHEDLLRKLHPVDVFDYELVGRVRGADDATLFGVGKANDVTMSALVRGALFYALDALDACHAVFQNAGSDLGSYWHGMMHRREADFDNARYWFRRAGTLPVFNAMQQASREQSPDMAKQPNWDPYLFTGQCEQARHGAPELIPELLKLQRVEFDVLFDYCWRLALRQP